MSICNSWRWANVLVLLVWPGLTGAEEQKPVARGKIDFAKDVRPLFEARCHECHDGRKQRGSFRLDIRADAMKGGEAFSPAIIPGNSAESPLIRIVSGMEDGYRMPPEGDLLTAQEIGVLRAWIDQGAVWPDELAGRDLSEHWSFSPPRRHSVPVIELDSGRSPIDAFLLERLRSENLSYSPAADKGTLIRRLSLDLLGLPPTLEDVAEFQADDRPDAYERLTDRLLASPHFGERWARHWLDVVRFAESNGFEMNQARPNAWPYRDFVIAAFNDDKPYDRFVMEQLAGDALGADVGTAFLVGGPWDQVKSPDIGLTLQQRADELHDMISTTGSAFLGLTTGCARCHSHKFDPISQTDYYAMKAALCGVQHGERPISAGDSTQRRSRAAELQSRLQQVEQELRQFEPLAFLGRTMFLPAAPPDKSSNGPVATPLLPPSEPRAYPAGTQRGQRDDPGDIGRLPNLGRESLQWSNAAGKDVLTWQPKSSGTFRVFVSWSCGLPTFSEDARYVLDLDGDLQTAADQTELAAVDQRTFADGIGGVPQQARWSGLRDVGIHRLAPESRIVLRGGTSTGDITADLLVLQEATSAVGSVENMQPRLHCRSAVRSNSANVERFVSIEARFVRFTVEQTSSPSEPCLDELEIWTAENSPRNVAAAALGGRPTSSGNFPDASLHQLAKVNDGKYGNPNSWISNEIGRGWVQIEFTKTETIDRVVWSRDQDTVAPDYTDRTPTVYRIEVSQDGQAWQTVASSSDRIPYGTTSLPVQMLPGLDVADARRYTALRAEQSELRQEIASLLAEPTVYAGRFTPPEETHRLHRGDPQQPREVVKPGGLSSFGTQWELSETAADSERRLVLARWVVDPTQPLTSRVIVNRLWQHHFGKGIVTTPSDFGRNGAAPSHPELLDWLSLELIAHDWSLKALHRQIITSEAYRQSSAANAEGLKIDAASRLLWRYPPRRLEAEPLRDTILTLCGNLDDRMGGRGFDLFEPNGNYVKVYNSKKEFGPAEWRRMVYQSKPRMQLDDTFGSFDCPDAGQIAPKRLTSTTALQALNLLNSRFIVQQAEILARRLEREAGNDPASQVRRAFQLAFYRQPEDTELTEATALIQEFGLPAFCRALLNANELLYVF